MDIVRKSFIVANILTVLAVPGCGTSGPSITSVAPLNGSVGTPVTITGSNFDATATNDTVLFNGTAAVVTSATTTSITTTVPPGATTGPVAVTVNGDTTNSPTNFFVSPTITNIMPTTASVGAPVTITGTNFDLVATNNTVTFNGVTATVQSATATTINTTVPAGAQTGPVVVSVSGLTATSPIYFTVN